MNRFITISLLFIVAAFSANAQENAYSMKTTDQLKKQLSVYLAEHPSSNLYLHLDKNIYSPQETLWFKAYLLSDTVTDNKVLYVRIADESKEVVLNGQFPMYDIRAHGDIQLPKRLTEGKYTLYAYTDRMLSYGDTNVFVQPIQIRKNIGRKLEAEAVVRDTTQLIKGGKVQVMVKVIESGGFAKKVKGEYELIGAGKSIKYGRLTTNEFGEAFINFTYPELADKESLKVNMLFSRDNDYAELSLNLPHEGNPLEVNIYPEGGWLLAGIAGKVAIEVLDIHGNPVSTELLVKNAGKLVSKLRTNKLGIASITLKPETGSQYTVELEGKKKQTVLLPEIIKPEGYSLKLLNSKEQCRVTVYNKNQREDALLVLRSRKEILWSKAITVAPGDSITVAIPAADFAKNILSLSIFDHENKPCAERLFLNREEEDYKITILTDRQDYGMQKKVRVTINIADTQGNPVVANLSVAATEKNRIDSTDYRNILQSWYYRPFGQANRNRFLSVKSTSEMDGLLMTNTWGNNQWDNISSYIPKGVPSRLANTDAAIGHVMSTDKQKITEINIKSPKISVPLTELNKSNIFSHQHIKVDENNRFVVPASELLSRKGNEWTLDGVYKGTKPDPEINFEVQWKDHDIHYDSVVLKGKSFSVPEIVTFISGVKNPVESDFKMKGINQLAEVIIGGEEEIIRRTLKNKCPDWVCFMNVVNCRGHYKGFKIPGKNPIKGNVYITNSQSLITYLGCGNYRDINYIKNITIPEEFYLPDYDTIPSPNEDTRSTIYWNPNIVTDDKGNATFSFFTSDIIGEFEIVAQGLEINTFKPLMGTRSFKVKIDE